MLVACFDELGKLAPARPDAAPQLVAGRVSRRLPSLGHRARSRRARLLDYLSDCACGFERTDGLSVERSRRRERRAPAPRVSGHHERTARLLSCAGLQSQKVILAFRG